MKIITFECGRAINNEMALLDIKKFTISTNSPQGTWIGLPLPDRMLIESIRII